MSPTGRGEALNLAAMLGVTGATGTIGRSLVRRLADRSTEVRAFSRRPGRGEPERGVEWVRADLAEPEGLVGAFRGVDRLFLLTGNSADMVRLQKNALRAALEAGVEHVVKLSALGATDHSRSVIGLWHFNVERELRESGLGWTLLRPHHFMQNVLDETVFDREAGRVHSASGEGRIPFVDTRDIAAVASEVLTGAGHAERTYTLTGPAAISYREATGILSDVLDRPLEYVAEDEDQAWRRLRDAGMATWRVAALLAIAAYQRAGGPTERTTDAVERLTGRPPRDFREFAEDHAAELAAPRGRGGEEREPGDR